MRSISSKKTLPQEEWDSDWDERWDKEWEQVKKLLEDDSSLVEEKIIEEQDTKKEGEDKDEDISNLVSAVEETISQMKTPRLKRRLVRAIQQDNFEEYMDVMESNLIDVNEEVECKIAPRVTVKIAPLLYACFLRRDDIAIDLVRRGADVNKKSNDGHTPLSLVCLSPHSPVGVSTSGTREEKVDIVKVLLMNGADVNVKTGNGMTPLMICAAKGKRAIAKMLMMYGADPTIKDAKGRRADEIAYAQEYDVLHKMLYNYYVEYSLSKRGKEDKEKGEKQGK